MLSCPVKTHCKGGAVNHFITRLTPYPQEASDREEGDGEEEDEEVDEDEIEAEESSDESDSELDEKGDDFYITFFICLRTLYDYAYNILYFFLKHSFDHLASRSV